MAILKLGELVAGIRGTIGGTTYSANKAGPFARGWSKGANPRTQNQTAQRAIASTHPGQWAGITQNQRDDWDTYAADPAQELTNSLGEPYYASGFNWFFRINTHLILSGRARRDAAPVAATPATPTVTLAACSEPITLDAHVFIFYPTNEFTGYDVIIALTLHPRATPIWQSRGYRFVHYTTQDTTTMTTFGLKTLELFGQPPAGGKCFLMIQKQNTEGRRSAITTKTANVASI